MNPSQPHSAQPTSLAAGALPVPEVTTLELASSREDVDQALAELHASKDHWARMDLAGKAALLDELHHDLPQIGAQWVNACLQAKGVPAGGFAEGEEWAVYSGVLRLVRLLRQSLRDIDRHGLPVLPGTPATLTSGQISVPVFPTSALEKMLFPGMRAETWLEPAVRMEELFLLPGSARKDHQPIGQTALVLGAGNMSAIQCADLLHKLFVEEQVVALKMHPVNAYLGPILEQGFKTLIQRGFLRILYGGADLGAYLCDHPLIDAIHLTGSDKTFEGIVFGAGEEGRRRKAEHQPRLAKPITAELGGINPVIIVPGAWSAKEIKRAALMLATWLYSNAGFACLAPRLIVQHRQWPQRQALLDALGQILADTPLRPAYYPGARARHAAFVAAHPEAQLYGTTEADPKVMGEALRWTLIPDVDASNVNDICFKTESFCALLSETSLDAQNASEFLAKATDFLNQNVWGTLVATVLAPDRVRADKQVGTALERAIADLHYGTICINQYSGFVYSLMTTPWGSFPGQEAWDIQSGSGFVNNPFMLRRPHKSIFTAPFQRTDPVTIQNRFAADFCKRYADFQSQPSPSKLIKVFRTAMKG